MPTVSAISRMRMWGSRARQTRTWPWLDSSVHWRRATGSWSDEDFGVGLMGSWKPAGSSPAPDGAQPAAHPEHTNEMAQARDAMRGTRPGRGPRPSAPVHREVPDAGERSDHVQVVCAGPECGPAGSAGGHVGAVAPRSEERRVGKEGRSRWSPYH